MFNNKILSLNNKKFLVKQYYCMKISNVYLTHTKEQTVVTTHQLRDMYLIKD